MFTLLRRRAVPVAFAAMLGFPVVAPFHTALKSSSPAKDEVLKAAPHEIRLTYTAQPELALSDIKVSTTAGAAVEMGKVARGKDSVTIVAPVRGAMPDGAYVITWRTAGKDGHVIRGRIPFSISASASEAAVSSARPCASAPADDEHAH
ncbi:MAG TPA: copper resistance CopC family protein [Gemmatimonadales bacterium]|nr:copper resistance CopC family protein [Gemmatimonadales bacterium]